MDMTYCATQSIYVQIVRSPENNLDIGQTGHVTTGWPILSPPRDEPMPEDLTSRHENLGELVADDRKWGAVCVGPEVFVPCRFSVSLWVWDARDDEEEDDAVVGPPS